MYQNGSSLCLQVKEAIDKVCHFAILKSVTILQILLLFFSSPWRVALWILIQNNPYFLYYEAFKEVSDHVGHEISMLPSIIR